MSELTASLATPHTFTHKDKTYTVSLITQEIQAKFEQLQFARACEAAKKLRVCMDKDEYHDHLQSLNENYISGHYSMKSQHGIEFAQSNTGMISLCSLLWGCDEQEMTNLLIACKDEIAALLDLVVKESFGLEVK